MPRLKCEPRRKLALDNCEDVAHLPPNSCIPSRANTTMNRKRRNSRLMMDFMELMRDTTRFLREAQYLTERKSHAVCLFEHSSVKIYTDKYATNQAPESAGMRCFSCEWSRCPTYLVILKILRSLSALSTLMPNDMPGLKKPQTTSKMLPTMTCRARRTAEKMIWS